MVKRNNNKVARQPTPHTKGPKRKVKRTLRNTRRNIASQNTMVNTASNPSKRYLDPEGKNEPPASTTSLGNFTTLNNVLRTSIGTAGTSYDVYLAVQWTPSSLRAISWAWITGGPSIPVTTFRLGSFISSIPVTSKPLRMSVAVRNSTIFTSTQGTVRVLCMPQSIDWSAAFATSNTLTDAFCNSIDSMIESNNKTNTFTAHELHKGKKWIFAPVSAVGYNNWYEQAEGASTQNTLVSGSIGDALTTFIMKMPYVANQNIYDVTIRSQDGARYPANSPLASTARSAQQARPGVMENIHHVASETSHIAEDVGNVFSAIGDAIPRIAGGIYNTVRSGQALRTLFSSAPYIEEAGVMAPLAIL